MDLISTGTTTLGAPRSVMVIDFDDHHVTASVGHVEPRPALGRVAAHIGDTAGMGASTDDADWAAYYRSMAGRAPRPLALRGAEAAKKVGHAVDLGCGDGTETLWLLDQGWSVTAVDREPAALALVEDRANSDRLRTVQADLADYEAPTADLVLACASLPFVQPGTFERVWNRVLAAARGGVVAANLFGDRDSWAAGPQGVAGMSFHTRSEVEGLLHENEVVALEEVEFDGPSGRGPKHWHRFDIVARPPCALP